MDLTVARITSAHALRGEVLLDVRTDAPADRFYPGATLRTDRVSPAELTVASVRHHHGRLAVRFEGVEDRTAAEELRGISLVVDADQTPPEEDAYYPHQLRGLRALDEDDRELGEVTDLRVGAAQDLLVVRRAGDEVLVPFVKAIVTEVDLAGGFVRIDPPGGLFEPAEED